jgi:hypothetical protein
MANDITLSQTIVEYNMYSQQYSRFRYIIDVIKQSYSKIHGMEKIVYVYIFFDILHLKKHFSNM